MTKYTTCVLLVSIFLIWLVQPSKAKYGDGNWNNIAPINCKGNRCPGGEVPDPLEYEDVTLPEGEGTDGNVINTDATENNNAPVTEPSREQNTEPSPEQNTEPIQPTEAAPPPPEE